MTEPNVLIHSPALTQDSGPQLGGKGNRVGCSWVVKEMSSSWSAAPFRSGNRVHIHFILLSSSHPPGFPIVSSDLPWRRQEGLYYTQGPIHSFAHSLHKYLLSTNYEANALRSTVWNTPPALKKVCSLEVPADNKHSPTDIQVQFGSDGQGRHVGGPQASQRNTAWKKVGESRAPLSSGPVPSHVLESLDYPER